MQYFFFYIGLAHTSGVKGAIMSGTSTFFAILLSTLLFKLEKLTLRKVLGCLLGFAGVVLINLKSGSDMGGGFCMKGEGFVALSTLCNAFAVAFTRIYSQEENPVVLCAWQFMLGGAVMIAVGLAGGGVLSPVAPSAWLLMAYMAFLSATAYGLWSVLLKHNDVSDVTIYTFFNPIFGVLLSAFVLNEAGSIDVLRCAVALLLVCAGIFTVNRQKRQG